MRLAHLPGIVAQAHPGCTGRGGRSALSMFVFEDAIEVRRVAAHA